MIKKHTLYLIGGLSQVGKTTIVEQIEREKKIRTLHTDDSRRNVSRIFPGEDIDGLAWPFVLKDIKDCDSADQDVLIEGIGITPERVQGLKLENLIIKAVFICYGRESYAETMLARAKKLQQGWVYDLIMQHGEDWPLRAVREGIIKSRKIKESAEKFGYGYFDITEPAYDPQAVVNYLFK